ncbi:MAG TPA: tol-pal system protein YbgF [Rhizomicrobium sp.]|nr:tol-pal system protein YbgF [Rhizomicrobium sp.]
MKKQLILGLFAATLAAMPAQAGLFGESDEEKAARIHEQNQDATIADLTQRVHDLEDSLRQATGQNETLAHQIQQLNDKIARQQKDFEYRLCTVTAQQLGANQDDQSAMQCGAGGGGGGVSSTFTPPPPQQQSQVTAPRLAPPPGSLGTLPAKSANAAPPPASGDGADRSQFNTALNLASKQRYDEARAQFRSFADANPDDEMAPQAVYWVGSIAYLQKDYAGAAHAFAEEIKKYPTSSRAPDSMLKLGQSFIQLGQAKEGCLALAALPGKYPNASKTVLSQAASERKAECH